ncbi:MAG: tetratricopeptide repeat protein [Bacteroidales bacterium OttesenSCG-928-I14]|jgi:tetratricopeptide (TPR) repeat protein|nr:tetratricopeptide repeat protein [Bacteroidales bacterium OttesenSCG-928-I14]
MFNDNNYIGCINKISSFKQNSQFNLTQEENFIFLASNFYQKTLNSPDKLIAFLATYPQSNHKNEIYFMIATLFFEKENYKAAEIWFNKNDVDLLPFNQQIDYLYRMGIILLRKENYKAANYFFSILDYQSNNKYKNASKYILAYIAYKNRNYDYALKNFLQLKNHPIFGQDALYYTTCIFFTKKEYTQILLNEKAILKNLANVKQPTNIKRLIGISYYYTNNYMKSIQYLESIKKKCAQDNTILGLSYFQLKKYNETIKYLTKNCYLNNVLGQNLYMYLGKTYLLIGEDEKALCSFETASKMDFNIIVKENATYNYAMLLYKNFAKNSEKVVDIMKNFIKTYPNSIYREKINNALITAYLILQNYESALTSIEKIEFPDRKLLEIKQKIHYYLGKVYFQNKLYDYAIQNFNNAIADGDYAINEKNLSFYLRGESQYQKKNYMLAEKDYKSYSKTISNNSVLNNIIDYNLGYCAFKQKNYKKAEQFFKSFLNTEKSNKYSLFYFDTYNRLGDCNFSNKNFIEAKNFYSRAINCSYSTSDHALFQNSCILGLQKKYQEKIDNINELIKKFPNSNYISKALYEKGDSYTLLGNKIEAIKTYQTLLRQYPKNDLTCITWMKLGALYHNNNQFQKSIEIYKYVISNYPKSNEAKDAIKNLESIYLNNNDMNSYTEYIKSLKEIKKSEIDQF